MQIDEEKLREILTEQREEYQKILATAFGDLKYQIDIIFQK